MSMTNPTADATNESGALALFAVSTSALLWLALAVAAAAAGATYASPGEPPLMILGFVLTPPTAFLGLYATNDAVRAWVARLDLATVTGMQSWRVLGLMFMPLAYWGHISFAFALPAALGDALVGLLAPFVALAVERRAAGWRKASYGLIGLGLLDFTAAVGMGAAVESGLLAPLVTPSPEPVLSTLPISLIPTVLVPGWIILHLVAWLKIRRAP